MGHDAILDAPSDLQRKNILEIDPMLNLVNRLFLLGAQGLNRIDGGGTACRDVAGNECSDSQNRSYEKEIGKIPRANLK